MTDLAELLERVEAASKPSEELDALILCALQAPPGSYVDKSPFNGAWCIYNRPNRLWDRKPWRDGGWPLTASFDAALALVEWVRPGDFVEISGPRKYLHIPTDVPNRWRATVGPMEGQTGWGISAALALLAALLRSLIQASAGEGGNFRCGHPKTPENSRSQGPSRSVRCLACWRVGHREEARRRRADLDQASAGGEG